MTHPLWGRCWAQLPPLQQDPALGPRLGSQGHYSLGAREGLTRRDLTEAWKGGRGPWEAGHQLPAPELCRGTRSPAPLGSSGMPSACLHLEHFHGQVSAACPAREHGDHSESCPCGRESRGGRRGPRTADRVECQPVPAQAPLGRVIPLTCRRTPSALGEAGA